MTVFALPHRRGPTTYARYVAASVGLMAIASGNGAMRELTYGRHLSEGTAHTVSLLPMVALFAAYIAWLERRWPLTARGAAAVGATWAAVALGFELGLGHYVLGTDWEELLRDYDLTQGRPGALVLLTAAAGPLAVRAALRHHTTH